MLYKIRTGDILLAKNKVLQKTNAYLVVNLGGDDGYGLICLSCGEKVGFYGTDKEKFREDIDGFLSVKYIVPKEEVTSYLNNKYKLKYELKAHDVLIDNHELGIEVER